MGRCGEGFSTTSTFGLRPGLLRASAAFLLGIDRQRTIDLHAVTRYHRAVRIPQLTKDPHRRGQKPRFIKQDRQPAGPHGSRTLDPVGRLTATRHTRSGSAYTTVTATSAS